MHKTNEKIVNLINGLMALDCVDDKKEKHQIENAIYKSKKELNSQEMITA